MQHVHCFTDIWSGAIILCVICWGSSYKSWNGKYYVWTFFVIFGMQVIVMVWIVSLFFSHTLVNNAPGKLLGLCDVCCLSVRSPQ